ncbi:SDR family oxidoreductase [Aquihabitans sp. G128]|uniref:SDR family NAD(P)-dependent oxidoreductase n=1 Tax=Aquihabitans sp. G128 TaxID=2849779 RepID=UPI001C242BCD|nr:SDR family oxidoreductase [Aquihabitans sp. G128]QXC59543.1 SDR family oxidoreductase [Aquihabitans sp. G128]
MVLVTGATGGVGRGIALACGEAGWTVWIAARREAEGTAVADEVTALGGQGRFVRCEAGEPASVQEAVATVVATDGALHGAVHNATSGLSPRPGSVADTTLADLRDHVAVSVRGTYLLARESLPHLEAVGGALLVLTSEAGFEGKARLPAYAAVKAAQRGLVRALAREWGPKGVRVNALAPLAATPAVDEAFRRDPAMSERVLGRSPMGRLGDAATEIGPVARFLLGPDAAFLTGSTLLADGGSCSIS